MNLSDLVSFIEATPLPIATEKPWGGPIRLPLADYGKVVIEIAAACKGMNRPVLFGRAKDGTVGPLFMGYVLTIDKDGENLLPGEREGLQ